MKDCCLIAAFALASAVNAETPSPTVTIDAANRIVTIDYSLETAAIVTVDLESDASGSWVAVPPESLWFVTGDVNKMLTAESHQIQWRPDSSVDLSGGRIRANLKIWAANNPPPYLATDLEATGIVRYYASEDAVPYGVNDKRYKTTWLLMRRIPAKGNVWRMGANGNDVSHYSATDDQHQVRLTHDYYVGVYEITQRQHELLTGAKPSSFANAEHYMMRPVETVAYVTLRGPRASADWPTTDRSVVGADSVIKAFRDKTGLMLDLPTSAEWEYAARAGTQGSWPNGRYTAEDGYEPIEIARYQKNSNQGKIDIATVAPDAGGTAIVGTYQPNAFGLYDVVGNVREFTLDWDKSDYSYNTAEVGTDGVCEDPKGFASDGGANIKWRAVRGGSWQWNRNSIWISRRDGQWHEGGSNEVGYRLALLIEN